MLTPTTIDNIPVCFKFAIKQDVKIIALNLPTRIMARCDRGNDIRDYRIVYWSEGKRYDDWVFEYELEGKGGERC